MLAVSRRADRLEALAQETAGKVIPEVADVAAEDSPERIISAARDRLGGLELLVNNAGVSWVGQFADMPAEELDRVISVNVRALMLLCRHAVPLLAGSGRGQIINVASLAAHLPMETMAVYCATKAAVVTFSEVLAKELSPRKIRVNVLSPSGTDTGIFDKVGVDIDRSLLVSAADMARMAILMTQWPESIDVGELVTQKRFVLGT